MTGCYGNCTNNFKGWYCETEFTDNAGISNDFYWSNCTTRCGDGVVVKFDYWDKTKTTIEECDDGNLINGDGCESDCTITTDTSTDKYHCVGNPSVCFISICGNGVLEYGEECEDTLYD